MRENTVNSHVAITTTTEVYGPVSTLYS